MSAVMNSLFKDYGFWKLYKAFEKSQDFKNPIIFSQDIKTDGTKRYLCFNYEKKIIFDILSKNHHVYETIQGNLPMPYTIDVDDKQKRDIPTTIQSIQNFLTIILTDLEARDIENLIQVQVLESADNATRKEKNSYHLIFPNIIFKDFQHFKNFTRYVYKQEAPKEIQNIFNIDLIKDRQQIRCVNQSKLGKTNTLQKPNENDENIKYLRQIYEGNPTPTDLNWDKICQDISFENTTLKLTKYQKQSLQRYSNNNYVVEAFTEIEKWLKLLQKVDFETQHILNKHYIDYLVSLIPNPDNQNHIPYSVWCLVRWCLIGVQRDINYNCMPAYVQLSVRANGFYKQDQKVVAEQAYMNDSQRCQCFNLYMLECLVKAMRPDFKRNFKTVYNSSSYDILKADMTPPDLVYNQKYMRNIDLNLADIHMMWCHMGGGKTFALVQLTKYELNKYIEETGEDPKNVFVYLITNRVALADQFKKDFEGFVHYQDNIKDVLIQDQNRLIVQLDSISKCIDMRYNIDKNRKIILVLDEVESVFNHLSSTTMRGKLSYVASTLYSLLKHSKKIICCDAFMTARTQKALQMINGNRSIIFHKNENHNIKRDLYIWKHNKSSKTKSIDDTENAFVAKVIELIKSGKRVVCPCSSKSVIEKKLKPALDQAGISEYKLYYSGIDKDDEEIKKDFSDANEAWNGMKCIAYSPIITIGTNNDTHNMFDQIVMFCKASNSCCARDMIQAHYRVRHLTDNKVHLFINNTPDYRHQPTIIKNIDIFAREHNFDINSEDQFRAFTHLILAYNKYEQQLSEWNYYDVLMQYFNDCNYTIYNNTKEHIEPLEEIKEEETDISHVEPWVNFYIQHDQCSLKDNCEQRDYYLPIDQYNKMESVYYYCQNRVIGRCANTFEKDCYKVAFQLGKYSKYIRCDDELNDKQLLMNFAMAMQDKQQKQYIINYIKLYNEQDDKQINTENNEIDIHNKEDWQRLKYIRMISDQTNYFKQNITTDILKNIYEQTTNEHYKMFQYRNQSKTNKFTDKFKDFVQHCLSQTLGISAFKKESEKRIQKDKTRATIFEYSYTIDIQRFMLNGQMIEDNRRRQNARKNMFK